jgi:hypothetical protein
MAGYMEGYGAGDERRSFWIKRIVFIGVPAVLIAVGAYFYFRTWSEERTMNRFLAALEQKKYDEAYGMWCNAQHPCRYYPPDKFNEDWGPSGLYGNVSQLKLETVDFCDSEVVFQYTYPKTEPFGLSVKRSTDVISFFPYARCPGKHLQIGSIFRRLFG